MVMVFLLSRCCLFSAKQKGKGSTSTPPQSLLPFPVDNLNQCNETTLKTVDDYLVTRSYLLGVEPSLVDSDALKSLKGRKSGVVWPDYPNLQRWVRHMESFSDEDSKKFLVHSLFQG